MSANKLLQAASGGAGESVYVEDVFSTYLYTANNSAQGDGNTQTINNGLDLSGEGGLVWIKKRGDDARSHVLIDTERGATKALSSNSTAAERTDYTGTDGSGTGAAFTSTGFTVGDRQEVNAGSGDDFCSWTFRKQAGFFDVVTYTGNGSNQAIAHNLGSKPGCVIIKETSSSGWNWIVFHRRLGASQSYDPEFYLRLNTNVPEQWGLGSYVYQEFDSENIYLRSQGNVNGSGNSYVAYLFAHDDQSFGDNSNESIIKCGSYTGSSTLPYTVNLGFEPQWLMIKRTDSGSADDWMIVDVMRGQAYSDLHILEPNNTDAENATTWNCVPTANGFQVNTNVGQFNGNGATYIYVAIRRPMKTPEAGTEVFNSLAYTGDGASTRDFDLGMTVDAYFQACRSSSSYDYKNLTARLTGKGLYTAGTGAEFTTNTSLDVQEGLRATAFENTLNQSSQTYIINAFKRAKGFFDLVAYTGDGVTGSTVTHNLGVTPELIIVKNRSTAGWDWIVYSEDIGATKFLFLNKADAAATNSNVWSSAPTSSVFSIGQYQYNNYSGDNFIAYLFATVAGVSKVGSYSGTGSDINVDCGFSSGARFVLIKRTDSTGDWYVYDSTRGIVAGNDPYLLLNTTAAEVTSTDYIDPLSSGFTVTSSAPAALNTSGGTYIFLAIA